MRYVIQLSYDGTAYGGWQIQPNAVTVQEVLQAGIKRATGQEIIVTASGRTDAGVHAYGQICHFDADWRIPPERIADCINSFLPDDIKIVASGRASEDFDSNRSAKKKTYAYHAYLSSRIQPLKERYSARIKGKPLHVGLMQKAAETLCGEHDFKAFCASGSQVKTTVRTLYAVEVTEGFSLGCTDYTVRVTGNGFLYNMVRTIAGTVFAIGAGQRSLQDLQTALAEADRDKLGKTMPAKGLILESVDYGFPLFPNG